MKRAKLTVREDGSVVLPAEYLEFLEAHPGDALSARVEGGEVRIFNLARNIRLAQELVSRYVPDGVSLVDELIAERRQEAEREERE